MKKELEDLIKMVHAVRLVPDEALRGIRGNSDGIVDGRIMPEDSGVHFASAGEESEEPKGRDLLKHSEGANEGFYTFPPLQTKS